MGISRGIKKHEGVFIAFIATIVILYIGESSIDSSSCSVKNPSVDCTQRGLIDISHVYPWNYTQTTGIGAHYINGVPAPEFRGNPVTNIYGGYQHVVCDLGNSTCEWHLDKYQALDFPFGTILHLADYLTLAVPGIFSEDVWQTLIWILIIASVYLIARFVEWKLE